MAVQKEDISAATAGRAAGHPGRQWAHFRLLSRGAPKEGRKTSRTKSGEPEPMTMTGHGFKFGRKMEAAIAALLSQRSREEAAKTDRCLQAHAEPVAEYAGISIRLPGSAPGSHVPGQRRPRYVPRTGERKTAQ
jgi:hypothetical protein